MLNWVTFLPLWLSASYITSYHSTIATMPFELFFGKKARLPLFPNDDIQKIHYCKMSAVEQFSDTNVNIKITNKVKVLNIEKLKLFFGRRKQ